MDFNQMKNAFVFGTIKKEFFPTIKKGMLEELRSYKKKKARLKHE